MFACGFRSSPTRVTAKGGRRPAAARIGSFADPHWVDVMSTSSIHPLASPEAAVAVLVRDAPSAGALPALGIMQRAAGPVLASSAVRSYLLLIGVLGGNPLVHRSGGANDAFCVEGLAGAMLNPISSCVKRNRSVPEASGVRASFGASGRFIEQKAPRSSLSNLKILTVR